MGIIIETDPFPMCGRFIIKTSLQSMPQDGSHDIDHTRNFTNDVVLL